LQNRSTQEALVEFRAIGFVRQIGRLVAWCWLRKRAYCRDVIVRRNSGLVGLILAEVLVCSVHGARCQKGDGNYAYPCAEEKLPGRYLRSNFPIDSDFLRDGETLVRFNSLDLF